MKKTMKTRALGQHMTHETKANNRITKHHATLVFVNASPSPEPWEANRNALPDADATSLGRTSQSWENWGGTIIQRSYMAKITPRAHLVLSDYAKLITQGGLLASDESFNIGRENPGCTRCSSHLDYSLISFTAVPGWETNDGSWCDLIF